jgi:molybdate/tungstate transport system substrate-binding protein
MRVVSATANGSIALYWFPKLEANMSNASNAFLAAIVAISISSPVLAQPRDNGRSASAAGTVKVLYAASLVNLMEHGVGPAFDKATGNQFQGYAMGSHGLANQFQGYAMGSHRLANDIKGNLRRGDVFISASPKVNDSLMGAANGDWESWYITFAQSPLVIGYNASSKFGAEFKTKPWYQVLQEPGIRIGRTAPQFDPKGELTLTLLKRAETFYNSPGLSEKIIGRPTVPEDLEIALLQSGVLDVGFFYSTETADAKIPALNLPPEITPKAVFTVTILHRAPNPEGADKFVAYLLGSDGRNLLKEHGLTPQKMEISGDASAVPQEIKAIVGHIK